MNARLTRSYRWLLHAYPACWRAEHGDELLATLNDLASPSQLRPTTREATSLLANGLRTRTRTSCTDLRAALAEGALWGVLMFLGLLPLGWRNSPGLYGNGVLHGPMPGFTWSDPLASIGWAGVVLFVLFIIVVRHPSRLAWITAALTLTAGGIVSIVKYPLRPSPLLRRLAPLEFVAVVVVCVLTVAFWNRRVTGTWRQHSRAWLAVPIGSTLFGNFGNGIVLGLLLAALLLGLLGLARLDPRSAVAALTVWGIWLLLDLVSTLRHGLLIPTNVIAPVLLVSLAATVRRHGRTVFVT